MARRVVVVVENRAKRKIGRKWKRSGIGLLLSIAVVSVNALGVLPIGVFGFIFTAVAATTFISLLDASYASLTGDDWLVQVGDDPDPDDHYDIFDRAN